METTVEWTSEANVFNGDTYCTIVLSRSNDGYKGTFYYCDSESKSSFQVKGKSCDNEAIDSVIKQCKLWIKKELGGITRKENVHEEDHFWNNDDFHKEIEKSLGLTNQSSLGFYF